MTLAIQEQLSRIDEAERALVLRVFGAQEAWMLGSRLREVAVGLGAPVSIEIRRSGGQTVFATSLSGATADTAAWAHRKNALALRFERSSLAVALALEAGGHSLEPFGLDGRDFALAGGAVPIRVAGAGCIGAIAMAGLTSEEDHAHVLAAIAWLHQTQPVGP